MSSSLRGQFQITLIGCADLPADDGMMSKADPYVTFQLGSWSHRSQVAKNGARAPLFNETFTVDVDTLSAEQSIMEIKVMDKGTLSDDFLGQCSIPASTLSQRQGTNAFQLVDLRDPNYQKSAGNITLSVLFTPAQSSIRAPTLQEAKTVTITVHEARGIPSVTMISKQDPFCTVRHGKQKFETRVATDQQKTPKWEQSFLFTLWQDETTIVNFQVSHKQTIGSKDICMASFELRELFEQHAKGKIWFKLMDPSNFSADCGEIALSIKFDGPEFDRYAYDQLHAAQSREVKQQQIPQQQQQQQQVQQPQQQQMQQRTVQPPAFQQPQQLPVQNYPPQGFQQQQQQPQYQQQQPQYQQQQPQYQQQQPQYQQQQQQVQYTMQQPQYTMQQPQYTVQQPQVQTVIHTQPQQQTTYQVHVFEDQFGRLIDSQGNQVDTNGNILVPANQVQWGTTTVQYTLGMPNVYLVGGVPRYMKQQRNTYHVSGYGPQRRVVVRPNGNVVIRNGGNRTVYASGPARRPVVQQTVYKGNGNVVHQTVSNGFFGPSVNKVVHKNNGATVHKTVSNGFFGPQVNKVVHKNNGATVHKTVSTGLFGGQTVKKTIVKPNGRVVTKVKHKNKGHW